MEAGAQESIADSSPTLATFRKDEGTKSDEAAWIEGAAWIAEPSFSKFLIVSTENRENASDGFFSNLNE